MAGQAASLLQSSNMANQREKGMGSSRPLLAKHAISGDIDDDDLESDEDWSDAEIDEQEDLGVNLNPFSKEKALRPFADEDGASKSLKSYLLKSSLNIEKDKILTSSGLNIVKIIMPKTLQLMTLCQGNHAFDLFLQLSNICQVYLYTVMCVFNTCVPQSYYDTRDIQERQEK